MQVNTLAPNTITGNSASAKTSFDSLGTEDFVSILLAELQNQNPLEPMDNAKLLDQFNSINALTTSNRLIETLESMTLEIEGVVDSAIVRDGRVFLTVGDAEFPIENVTELKSSDADVN
jgi:flagellar basal-body rod modification protein FlgD